VLQVVAKSVMVALYIPNLLLQRCLCTQGTRRSTSSPYMNMHIKLVNLLIHYQYINKSIYIIIYINNEQCK
jgi:hypothetical protein